MDSAKYVFDPQTVIARDGTLRGEILIDTYLGQKWTSVNGMPQIMKQNFAAYSSPEAKIQMLGSLHKRLIFCRQKKTVGL